MRLIYEIKAASNIIKRNIDCELLQSECYEQITASQCKIISYLSINNDKDIFQKDIEKAFSVRRSTATKTLQLMEKNGLILRAPSKSDGRLKKLILTEKAESLAKSMDKVVSRIEKKAEKGLTEEEKQMFLSVMNKIKNNLLC